MVSEGFSGDEGEKPVSGGEAVARDLFGRPVEPLRDRRGRPSFAKTPENQDFVAVRAAAGWAQAAIADAIGCDEKTLRKHFSRELSAGRLIVEGMALDVLMKKLREGHGPSIRLLLERMDETTAADRKRARRPAEEDEEGDDEAAPRRSTLGKKEIADREAQLIPDDWAEAIDRRGRQ